MQRYMADLVYATRTPDKYSEDLDRWIDVGGSPRASLALDKCSRTHAWLNQRDFVDPEDVRAVVHDCLRHRLMLSYEAQGRGRVRKPGDRRARRTGGLALTRMSDDPRIHVSLPHLRSLEGGARGLSFLPKQASASVLNGRHASRLRGRGLNFEEMRDYLPGDDIRSIDWKATARTGSPHVRVFTEERDRPALLVVDQSMSMFFGTRLNMKSVTAAEAAAIAAFRILDVGDRVGGIVFNDDEQFEFVPKRSQRTVFAFLESIANANLALDADRQVTARSEGLNGILKRVARIAHHNHLVIIFSDFDGIDDQTHRHLTGIAQHNDLILMHVFDPTAEGIGAGPRTVIGSGLQQAELDLGSASIREAVDAYSADRIARIYQWQQAINLSVLSLSAGEETLPQIRQLMGRLAPRRRVR